jgi:hypothetical protein
MNYEQQALDLIEENEALKAQVKGWISVDDDLPDFDSIVWVCFINGVGENSYTSSKYVNLKYCAHHDGTVPTWYVAVSSGHVLKTVTHWMPILKTTK